MAGEVLEHRQQARVAQPAGVGARVVGDGRRVGAEGAIADHGVVRRVGDVGDRREVDGDAELSHRLPAREGDVVDLVGRVAGRQYPRRRLAADQPGQPGHSAALLVDAHGERQRARRRGDVGQRPVGEHREVRPAADEDAAGVVAVDDRPGVCGAGDPDHEQLRQLVAGRHARKQHFAVAACRRGRTGGGRRATGRGHRGRPDGARLGGGLFGGGRAGQQEPGHCRQCEQGSGLGHGPRH